MPNKTLPQAVMAPEALAQLEKIFGLINDGLTKKDFMEAFEAVLKVIQDTKKTNETEFEAIHQAVEFFKGQIAGEMDGKHKSFTSEMVNKLEGLENDHAGTHQSLDARIASLEAQEPLDTDELLDTFLGKIPVSEEKEIVLDTPDQLIEKINNGTKLISRSAIEGLDEDITTIKKEAATRATPGWGAHPLAIQGSGTTKVKVARTINFTGATVTHSPQGVTTVAITGGGTGFQQPTSGAVDGSNTVFVFTNAPNAITVDGGRAMQKVSSDGTVNWTGTTTITLAIAPTFDIFSSA